MKRRVFSVLTALALCLSLFPAPALALDPEEEWGDLPAAGQAVPAAEGDPDGTPEHPWSCGTGVTATLVDGTLTISGSGAITDYKAGYALWYSVRDDIANVVIESGITAIGMNAFYGLTSLNNIDIPATSQLTRIGTGAFANCSVDLQITYGGTAEQWNKIVGGKNIGISEDQVKTATGYTITIIDGGDNSSNGVSYVEGQTATVFAGTKVGFSFDKWTTSDLSLTNEDAAKPSLTFTMPAHAVTLTAAWTQAVNVASVTKDNGATYTYFPTLQEAVDSVAGETATITLLADVELTAGECMVVGSGNGTITLDGNNHSITNHQSNGSGIWVNDGNLTISDVTVNAFVAVDVASGPLTIQSGTFTGTTDAVSTLFIANDEPQVQLYGGTFVNNGGGPAIMFENGRTENLLAPSHCYKLNDTPLKKDECGVSVPKSSSGGRTITVEECDHEATEPTSNHDGTHQTTCPYCGKAGATEKCTYTFSGTTGTCATCNDAVTVEVTGTSGLVYNGSEHKPAVTVERNGTTLTENTDYTVTYANNINAGTTASVSVTMRKDGGRTKGPIPGPSPSARERR